MIIGTNNNFDIFLVQYIAELSVDGGIVRNNIRIPLILKF